MTSDQPILVVEDNLDLLRVLQLMLERAGYTVLPCTDGAAALLALASRPVALILADIGMPLLNGYQFYERVRANTAWKLVPFVFISGRGLDSDVRFGRELGADDYLIKPVARDDLLAVVRGRLARATQLSCEPVATPLPRQHGPLLIDVRSHRVWRDGEVVVLTAREFLLLDYLAQQDGKVVATEQLLRLTHSIEAEGKEAGALLRSLVRAVRRKLGYGVGETGCIANVRGIGYRFSSDQ